MDPLPAHRERPHVRPFLPIGVENEEKKVVVALRDPSNLRGDGNAPVVPPEILPLFQLLQGEHTLEEITEKTGAPREFLVQLVTVLDEAGLLWGPNAERLEKAALDRIRAAGAFPKGAASAAGDAPDEATSAIRSMLDAAEDPELDGELLGIIAPHLDYGRGGRVYASSYKALARIDRPDRIVILGTNHFGIGDGIVMTTHGFDSPWGAFAPDAGVLSALEGRLGDRLFKDEIDLLAEHSISIQLPWIHTTFGKVPLVAALVPNPLRPMIADDGARVTFDEFVEALRDTLAKASGRTLVVASADLSHIGPQFGDETPVGTEIRAQVERYDRALLSTYLEGNMDAFLGKVGADRNAQRWCSVGNMVAAKLVTGALPELIEYGQTPAELDPQGHALVSCESMGLLRVD